MGTSQLPILIFTFLLFLLISAASPAAAAVFDLWAYKCTGNYGNYTSNSTYKSNLDKVLTKISTADIPYGFYNFSSGKDPDQVTAIALCRGDINVTDCHSCLAFLAPQLTSLCPTQVEAVGWAEKCMLRYSSRRIFGQWAEAPFFNLITKEDVTNADHFANVLEGLLRSLPNQTASGDSRLKFTTGEAYVNASQKVYAMMQCTPDLPQTDCLGCLYWLMYYIHLDEGYTGARVFNPSCYVRFALYKFYMSSPASTHLILSPPKEPVHRGKRLPLVLKIVGIPTFGGMLLMTLGMWFYLRNRRALTDFEGYDTEEITAAESLQMEFNKVRSATQNFSPDRKLGEGGFGDVFKGELDNGQEIAVKRLTTSNSGQGAAEFRNEVVLVAKLQHRNLVKLLGFCLTGKEKILVYEYMRNSSLDKVLFDPIKRASLDWGKRFNIICGIAKGLLYLHQDSRLRIIHRDLKSSNILLDEAMNPKISDFGIAKMLALDQTRASTDTLAGTYSYMAPEYMLIGQYSLKSDIYSFGILVIEIVTGQRNQLIGRPLFEEALLHRAWRLWSENAVLEMVDSALNDAYSIEEVVKCIHIGLLCIQIDGGKRPTMTSVVTALSGKSIDLPTPTPPTFFDANCSSSTSTTITTTATSQPLQVILSHLYDDDIYHSTLYTHSAGTR